MSHGHVAARSNPATVCRQASVCRHSAHRMRPRRHSRCRRPAPSAAAGIRLPPFRAPHCARAPPFPLQAPQSAGGRPRRAADAGGAARMPLPGRAVLPAPAVPAARLSGCRSAGAFFDRRSHGAFFRPPSGCSATRIQDRLVRRAGRGQTGRRRRQVYGQVGGGTRPASSSHAPGRMLGDPDPSRLPR